jgi:hypothetical protein
MMHNHRIEMDRALRDSVVPVLRRAGFKGTFPHYRRIIPKAVDLLTFQFDRNGGGFVIEIGRSDSNGYTNAWGKHIAPTKVSAWDLHPYQRYRIQPVPGGGTESWFRFDHGQTQAVVLRVLEALEDAEAWWQEAVPSAAAVRV